MNIAKATEQISYSMSGTGTLLGLAFNEWLALGGFILMLLTFAMNTYYRRKADKREEKIAVEKYPELDI